MPDLNSIMDFDHVIEVKADGSIVDRPDIFAPSLFEDELDDESWSMLDGFSGQDRYTGPIMHNSEFIGGAIERRIRETPGLYVAIVSNYDNDEDPEGAELLTEGWAIAYREAE